jgi:hypothetical protein
MSSAPFELSCRSHTNFGRTTSHDCSNIRKKRGVVSRDVDVFLVRPPAIITVSEVPQVKKLDE